MRTPIGRHGGVLASVRTDDLAAIPLQAIRGVLPSIDWAELDDVIFGATNQAGEDNRNVARMAALLAGLPETVPGATVNRLCASGLEAVMCAARAIWAGDGDLYIAGGVESMSRAPLVLSKANLAFARDQELVDTTVGWRFVNPKLKARVGDDSMPQTGENVARQWNISRSDQDAFALRSQRRAATAMANGRLAREIVSVSVPSGKGDPRIVDRDEHPRPETSAEGLARLRPITESSGTVTAGNSSGINDGAAAMLIASEAGVAKHGLEPLARITAQTVVGVSPRVMGIGPVPAVEKLLTNVALSMGEIDLVELNEAFASQALAVLRILGLPDDADHVNPNGGAIALGHPLGMTGARLAATAAIELHERGLRRAIVTMCVGVGQGMAVLLESV